MRGGPICLANGLLQGCGETRVTLDPARFFPDALAKLFDDRFAIRWLTGLVRLSNYPMRSGQIWIEFHGQTTFLDGQAVFAFPKIIKRLLPMFPSERCVGHENLRSE